MNEGTFVRTRRLKTGLTQKQLAAQLGMDSGQQINNIECSRAPLPAKHIKKLADIFGVPVQSFIRIKITKFKKELMRELDAI